LGCRGADYTLVFVVEVAALPVELALEERLPPSVVEFVPEAGTDISNFKQPPVLLLRWSESEGVGALHPHTLGCASIYRRIVLFDTFPAVETKYEFVQSEGSLSRWGNSRLR